MSYLLDLDNEADSKLLLHTLAGAAQQDSDSEKGYMLAIERYLEESDSHEVNERDSRGRTALHVAVQFQNIHAIVGLLMSGADINVGDNEGKSPFTYLLDALRISNIKSNHIFYTLHGHVHKLLALGLEVSEENRRCYGVARTRYAFNDKQLQIGYALELDKMEDVVVAKNTTLRDLLFGSVHVVATSTVKRRILEEIVTARDFCDHFPKLCCLIMLHYRRAVSRRKLISPAMEALENITDYSLPYYCANAIIFDLSDEDLINLIKASEFLNL